LQARNFFEGQNSPKTVLSAKCAHDVSPYLTLATIAWHTPINYRIYPENVEGSQKFFCNQTVTTEPAAKPLEPLAKPEKMDN
jgi:hypothetical protein